jgi:hypothetical protein
MADFSLSLNDDQLQLKDWVHQFAVDTIRPAAHEWDEREEFPWPVVQEAAKIGLYGLDFIMNAMADPTGLTMVVAIEEMFWGDAGIGMAIMGSGLAAAGIAGNGTPEQMMEWVPQCYGTPEDVKLGAFCVSEPDAGSDVSNLRTRAIYDEANDEWVLNGTKRSWPSKFHRATKNKRPESRSKIFEARHSRQSYCRSCTRRCSYPWSLPSWRQRKTRCQTCALSRGHFEWQTTSYGNVRSNTPSSWCASTWCCTRCI